MNAARKALRLLLEGDKLIVAPGAHNGISARIIEKVGFKALYATGYGASASQLSLPDVGLMTMTEMVDHMNNLVEAVSIPVIADGDTGYGNVINTVRTVRQFEKAGVAAIQLEDQVMPKKCGHMLGREIVARDEMVGKIEASVEARTDDDLVIIARTDARTKYGIDEAIRRGQAYAKAGADVIFIESPETIEEMKLINRSIEKPTLANVVERGRTPQLPAGEMEKIGYKIAIFPISGLLAATKALFEVFGRLMETGSTNSVLENLYDFEGFNLLMGVEKIREMEGRYQTKL
ncbi:MAG: isocitrate lyase/PEP mutase family protein [Syntrophobacteraceae bacterium]|nr:isocitrate lyase/PEP mutase family protein [Syntrophobacteraceae bacterium]